MSEEESVKVYLRIRPLNQKESEHSDSIPWEYSKTQIRTTKSTTSQRTSTFDSVLGPESTQEETFKHVASGLVSQSMQGFNATIFAYGQTGSGKTYSVSGVKEFHHEHAGIAPRTIEMMFDHIKNHPEREFLLRMAFIEIYNEEINDLLGAVNKKQEDPGKTLRRGKSDKLSNCDWQDLRILREDPVKGCIIENLTEVVVDSPERALEIMIQGESIRHVGETNMNARSSRSHLVMRFAIESSMPEDPVSNSDSSSDDDLFRNLGMSRRSKPSATKSAHENKSDATVSYLNLVDLAGSERQSNARTSGLRLKEGAAINQSLLNLGKVISKLSESSSESERVGLGKKQLHRTSSSRDAARQLLLRKKSSRQNNSHIPYRNSKLTRILKSSLGGNASTAVLLTMTGAPAFADESLSTIKFGELCKQIKNKVRKNGIGTKTKTMLRQYRSEIESLRKQLESLKTSNEIEHSVVSSKDTMLRNTQGALEKARQESDEANKRVAELHQRLSAMKLALFNSSSRSSPRSLRSSSIVTLGKPNGQGDEAEGLGSLGGSNKKIKSSNLNGKKTAKTRGRKQRQSMFITNSAMKSLRFLDTKPKLDSSKTPGPVNNEASFENMAFENSKKRVHDLTRTLNQEREKHQELYDKYSALRIEHEEALETIAALKADVEAHEKIEADTNKRVAHLEQELVSIGKRLVKTENEKESHEIESKRHESNANEMQKALAVLQEQHKKNAIEREQNLKELKAEKEEIEKKQMRLKYREEESAEKLKRLSNLEEKLNIEEERIEENKMKIEISLKEREVALQQVERDSKNYQHQRLQEIEAKKQELDDQILTNRQIPLLQRAVRERLHHRLAGLVKNAESRNIEIQKRFTILQSREGDIVVREHAVAEREATLKNLERQVESARVSQAKTKAKQAEQNQKLLIREEKLEKHMRQLADKEAAAKALHDSSIENLNDVTTSRAHIDRMQAEVDAATEEIVDRKRNLNHERVTLSAREANLTERFAILDEKEALLKDRERKLQEMHENITARLGSLHLREKEMDTVEEAMDGERKHLDERRSSILAREAELKEREVVAKSFMSREMRLAKRRKEQETREDEFFMRSAVEVSRVHRRERVKLEHLVQQQQQIIKELKNQIQLHRSHSATGEVLANQPVGEMQAGKRRSVDVSYRQKSSSGGSLLETGKVEVEPRGTIVVSVSL